MTKDNLKSYIRNVPDFPKVGVNFLDITTAVLNFLPYKKLLKNYAISYLVEYDSA